MAIDDIMRRFYPILLRQAFADANDLLGVSLDFDLENEFVQSLLVSLAKRVTSVDQVTKDEIERLTKQGAQEGWSTDELAKRIREHGGAASRSRSVAIARTESTSAYSQGSLLAYKESGVVSGVEWLTAGDPCDICDPLNGQVVALDKEFPGDIPYPPAHPMCRCVLLPVVA